jgi:hypothetical protein
MEDSAVHLKAQVLPPCRASEDKQQMMRQINMLVNEIIQKQQEAEKKGYCQFSICSLS